MAKTIYHGALRELSPVTVKVIAKAKDSKYKGKPPYVELEVQGDERYYETENDNCADFFDDLEGQTVTLTFEGSRDEVYIELAAAPAGNRQQQRKEPKKKEPPRQPPADKGKPAPRNDSSRAAAGAEADKETTESEHAAALKGAKHFIARNSVLTTVALQALLLKMDEWESACNDPMPVELACVVYTSLLFGTNSSVNHRNLPTAYKLTAPKKEGAK